MKTITVNMKELTKCLLNVMESLARARKILVEHQQIIDTKLKK